jgi:hypothetical protein
MLDCGQSLLRPWFPSITFSGQVINTLLLMNLDEDHVEDLEDLWKSTKISTNQELGSRRPYRNK